MIERLIGRLAGGEDLSRDEAREAISQFVEGRCREEEIALFLVGMANKGETALELAGAAEALRQHMTPIRSHRTGLLDTCGTGGDGAATFNISTAAALVTAACGVPVAKHGNRRVTSRTGSADVLAALGVNIEADVPTLEACLDEVGICFCFAPLLHGAMRHVAPVRQKLGIRTIFNLLGPLTNPANAEYQLLGVGQQALRPMLAEALAMLGTRRAAVVTGRDGLDEVTLSGPSDVTLVGGQTPEHLVWTPSDFGIEPGPLDALVVDGPAASAAMISRVLEGESGPARQIVLLNAAAALWVAQFDADLRRCAARAAEAIDSGEARALLSRLAARSRATADR